MNDLFNILIFSKDYNQGVIIQDYIKAIGYNSQVFDQEEAAYEGFLSRNFTLCIINHDIDTKETRTLAAMIKSSENIIPVVFLCEHPTREEIALLFSFHADDVIRKPLDTDILQARIKAVQSRYQPQRKRLKTDISFRDAFIIGVAQACAVLPGLSRSGSTIATGILLGNNKENVARFSFLMVLVPILGEAFLDMMKGGFAPAESGISMLALVVGFLAAFISGYIACSWMLNLVKKGKLIWFAVYCFVVGIIILFVH